MNWEALGATGEVLGSLILIASIFYLSRQIRSGTDQATAEAESAIQRDFNGLQNGLISDDKTISIMRRGFHSFHNLSEEEKFFFHMKVGSFVNYFEGVLRRSEKGLASVNIVGTYGNVVLTMLGSPGGREFWRVAGGTFQDLSTRYIDDNLQKGGDWQSLEKLFPYFVDTGKSDHP